MSRRDKPVDLLDLMSNISRYGYYVAVALSITAVAVALLLGLFFLARYSYVVAGATVWLLSLPVYLFLSAVTGASYGPRMGELRTNVLWCWWPLYGPYRLWRRWWC